jgi:hypothetical protein
MNATNTRRNHINPTVFLGRPAEVYIRALHRTRR